MEPNAREEGVPDVDFTIAGAAPIAGATEQVVIEQVVMRFPSFEDFYRSSRTPIARALAMTLRDTELASDAVDEAMARAYQRWAHVSQLDNPGGWVYRVGLNWSLSALRRLQRRTPIWVATTASTPAPSVQDPAIDVALATLTVDQRAVVVCRLLLGLSEAQTADALGIRAGTVKSRLHRAIERLTPLLTNLEETS